MTSWLQTSGHRREQVSGAIKRIADALDFSRYEELARGIGERELGPSLGLGSAGLSVFFAELYGLSGRQSDAANAIQYADVAIDYIGRRPTDAGLLTGFTGVLWSVKHIASHLGGAYLVDQASLDELDRVVEQVVSSAPDDYDLTTGLIGLGTYLLTNQRSALRDRGIQSVLDHLEAQQNQGTAGWWTVRVDDGEPKLDLGLAHGLAGVVSFLSGVVVAYSESTQARQLLSTSAWTLTSSMLPAGSTGCFPARISSSGKADNGARAAWCYGDPGVACALLRAGRALRDRELEAVARRIALHAASRRGDAGVVDACWCHGSAGLMHLFRRLASALGEPAIAETTRYWEQRTLDYGTEAGGVAGYAVVRPSTGERIAAPGLLDGAAGVGLSMIASVMSRPPKWDYVLLVAL